MALLCFGNTELPPHALYSLYADSPFSYYPKHKKSIHNDLTGVFHIYFGISLQLSVWDWLGHFTEALNCIHTTFPSP